MEGLAYVAQRKGAKSVMASLWVVSDRGTKELMLKFYELRKTHPELTKGEALRQAQLALLKGDHDPKGPALNNPYYWAPFVLIGNWR
jgi:CHAT domain-containing protein